MSNAPAGPDAPNLAADIVRQLRKAGFETYWAGGCVRDRLMNRTPRDYDIATAATPARIQELFPRHVATGKAFGVIQVCLENQMFEVATFREDQGGQDGRHPDSVRFSGPEQDALRRDFTINGLFFDPIADRIIDFVGGRADIERRVVRAIGDPAARFREDYLRMLRAVRFASTLDFALDEPTAQAIRELASHITVISAERIQAELTRLLTESPRAGQGVRQLRETGLLQVLLPEVERMAGQAQPPEFHPEGDVLTHTLIMLDGLNHPSPTLAYAALLHDMGKPDAAYISREPNGSERIRFDRHAALGADLAESLLKRLRLPADLIRDVTWCVRNHMKFMDVKNMRKSTLRQMVGAPTFPDELELNRLDCAASHGLLDSHDFLVDFIEQLRHEPVLPKPWINGHDLMALGIPEGPAVGAWHKKAYEAQLEGRFAGREELLAWLREEWGRNGAGTTGPATDSSA